MPEQERHIAKALITRQVEDCIRDVINIIHTRVFGEHGQCLPLTYRCGIINDYRINIEIQCPVGPGTLPAFSSVNIKQVENLGGKIEPIENKESASVVICLPPPIKFFIHSGTKTPGLPLSGIPKNPYPFDDPAWGEAFYGRHGTLNNVFANIFEQAFLIQGEWRVGKTSLLYKIHNRLSFDYDCEYFYIPVFLSLDGVKESAFWFVLYEKIRTYIATVHHLSVEKAGCNPADYTNLHFMEDIGEIVDRLAGSAIKVSPDQEMKIVVIIDEAQCLNSYSDQTKSDLRRLFSQDETLSNVLSVIFSGHGVNLSSGPTSSPSVRTSGMSPPLSAWGISVLLRPRTILREISS